MMDLHPEVIYCPYLHHEDFNVRKIGYVISSSKQEVRDRFAELMDQKWKDLYKQGWRIVSCEVIGDERECDPDFIEESLI